MLSALQQPVVRFQDRVRVIVKLAVRTPALTALPCPHFKSRNQQWMIRGIICTKLLSGVMDLVRNLSKLPISIPYLTTF